MTKISYKAQLNNKDLNDYIDKKIEYTNKKGETDLIGVAQYLVDNKEEDYVVKLEDEND